MVFLQQSHFFQLLLRDGAPRAVVLCLSMRSSSELSEVEFCRLHDFVELVLDSGGRIGLVFQLAGLKICKHIKIILLSKYVIHTVELLEQLRAGNSSFPQEF